MLYEKLKEHANGGVYPMHMPGHKRNTGLLATGLPYDFDITEIHNFDDLYNPQGVLLETAELAAELYGSDKAFLLVNGSTVGILAAIGAHVKRGEKFLAIRNNHRSVENAASLFGLNEICLTPEIDEYSGVRCSADPAAIEAAVVNDPGIRLVVVTSPSYEGVISDIRSISDIVHRHGIPLFVDAAHGAHLGFSPGFPENPVRLGADAIVTSLHKTLPALTQCSLLHVCGERADTQEIKRLLSVLQTSSPSYVLMASIDHCLRLLASDKDRLFSEYEQNLKCFYSEVEALRKIKVLGNDTRGRFCCALFACAIRAQQNRPPVSFDPGKIVIVTKNTTLSGYELADILRTKYKIELELARDDYALAMTSICDAPEAFRRLANALLSIDREL